jgi:signal transduction histidine kinase
MFERMASRFRRLSLPRSLVGRSLLASVSALLLVMALLGILMALVLALDAEPFPWEGPAGQQELVESAMHFDKHGNLVFIQMPQSTAQAFDALAKDMAFQVLDAAGNEVFASPDGPALDVLRRIPARDTPSLTRSVEGEVALQVLTTPIDRDGKRYMLRNARSERLALGIRSSGSAIFYYAAIFTGLLAVLVFTSIALWMARRSVLPLRRASEAAAAIQPSNLTQRVDARDLPSEVAPLVDAFNSALERLEKGYRVQQEFLAAAAHELKTPLALMRAEIELGNVASLDLLLEDIDSMGIQVQQLLQLAEVSEIQNFQFVGLDVRPVVEETVAYAARFAEGKDVNLRLVVAGAPGLLQADGGALSTLVKNLIENAVHYSAPGDVVTVTLTDAAIVVRDHGPGVAPEDVAKLFTRFWRSEGAPHQGAGLGLSICQQIAGAHGWRLAYRDASPGPGAQFEVDF